MGNALVTLHNKFQPLDTFQSEVEEFLCQKPLNVAVHLHGFSIAIYGEKWLSLTFHIKTVSDMHFTLFWAQKALNKDF